MDLAIPFNSRNNYFEEPRQTRRASRWPAIESEKNWTQLNENNLSCDFSVGAGVYQFPSITVSTYGFTLDAINNLDDRFFLRNGREIKNFINLHPELVSYLNDAGKVISKYFPQERLEVDLVSDAEAETNIHKTLFAYILTNSQPESALTNLKIIDKELFEKLEIDSHFFNINLEFIDK